MKNEHIVTLAIANLLIRLESHLSLHDLGIEKRFSSFVKNNNMAKKIINVKWKESACIPQEKGTLIFDPGNIWKLYETDYGYCAYLSYSGDNPKLKVNSILEINPNWDDFVLHEERNHPKWLSILNAGAGELILRTSIINNHGMVFHSSGLDDNGKGILFIGHAGAGKSTQLDIWMKENGVIGLNDDRIAVSIDVDNIRCHGTPWGGSSNISNNHTAPLKAIIVLDKAKNNQIYQISNKEASSLLFARSFLPIWDKDLMQKAMITLDTIVKKVPVFFLECKPGRETVNLVRSVL